MLQDGRQVGIVGGGRGGMALLQLFAPLKNIELAFVLDPNPQAVAIVEAGKRKIPTLQRLDQISPPYPPFIVDATGRPETHETLRERFGIYSTIIESPVALFLSQCFKSANKTVQEELLVLQGNIAKTIDTIEKVVSMSEDTTEQIKILALNAQIEAARTGETGKRFSVIASELRGLIDVYNKNQSNIESLTDDSRAINESLLRTVRNLAD